MALELGLGVTPWSPLKSGVLSGKYTRENAATVKADRGERVTQNLGEKVYAIIDELIAIGKELQREPGVGRARVGAGPAAASRRRSSARGGWISSTRTSRRSTSR